VLVPPSRPRGDAHMEAFYNAIRTGQKNPADLPIAATAALTAILGRDAIYQKKMKTWAEFGIEI